MWPFKKKEEGFPKRDWVYEKITHHTFPLEANEMPTPHYTPCGAEYCYRYDLISGERQLLIYIPLTYPILGENYYNLGRLGKVIDWRVTTEYEINAIAEKRSIDNKLAQIEQEERSAKIVALKAAWAELDEK